MFIAEETEVCARCLAPVSCSCFGVMRRAKFKRSATAFDEAGKLVPLAPLLRYEDGKPAVLFEAGYGFRDLDGVWAGSCCRIWAR